MGESTKVTIRNNARSLLGLAGMTNVNQTMTIPKDRRIERSSSNPLFT